MLFNTIAPISAKQLASAIAFSALYIRLCICQAPCAECRQLDESTRPPGKTIQDTFSSKTRVQELKQVPDGVYIFYDPLCPICREYFPYLDKLAQEHKELPFHLVFGSVADKARQEFQQDYQPHMGIINDKSKLLQNLLKAKVTPEAVLVKSAKIIYRGRIDDRYAAIGKRRSLIGSYDLENALRALKQNQVPKTKETIPIGCFLESTETGGN